VARIVGGLGVSHAPSIGAIYDRKETETEQWAPLFASIREGGEFLKRLRPDALLVFYNDHMDQNWLDNWPTFQVGIADQFEIADEGFGPRGFPPVPGHRALAEHVARSLVESDFDISVSRDMEVDHGIISPLPVVNEQWIPIVPVGVNVVWEPLPSPRRCWQLGEAVGAAIQSFEQDIRVAVIGTGGLSHEIDGPRFGTIYYEWDRQFLDLIESEPRKLLEYSMADFQRLGGHHSVEIVQWIAMRAAVQDAPLEFKYYYPKQVMGYAVAAFAAPEA
jgi:gallate dioxygenase